MSEKLYTLKEGVRARILAMCMHNPSKASSLLMIDVKALPTVQAPVVPRCIDCGAELKCCKEHENTSTD